MKHTPRKFLQGLYAAGVSTLLSSGEPAHAGSNPFTHPVGVQLYTVGSAMGSPDKDRQILQALADIGYSEIEYFWGLLEPNVPIIHELGLKIPSVSLTTPLVTGNWEPWEPFLEGVGLLETANAEREKGLASVAAAAHEAGAWYAMVPYFLPDERQDLDAVRRLADQMNAAGEVCRNSDLRLCYHNHAWEFETINGQRPVEVLVERLDPALIDFELDVFWVAISGEDPVTVLNQLRGRVPLLHLKDLKVGTDPTFRESSVSRQAFRELGKGSLNFPEILTEASVANVQHYFVEQDATPGVPLDSLRESYRYLRSLDLG